MNWLKTSNISPSFLQLANRSEHFAKERLGVSLSIHFWWYHFYLHCFQLNEYVIFRRYGSSLSESDGSKPGRRHSHTVVNMTESDSPPQLPSPTRILHPSSTKTPLTNVGEWNHWLPGSKTSPCLNLKTNEDLWSVSITIVFPWGWGWEKIQLFTYRESNISC